MSEIRKCKWSGLEFEITDEDIAFYKKIGVPLPALCPLERDRRRIIWRNERFLYKQPCDLCGKNFIAMYPKEAGFPIYCQECFWSDKWDPLDFGRDFDFSRPFFEQFEDLFKKVPQLSIFQANNINSDYTLNCINNKNCYLTSGADYNEDSMYGINTQRSKSCVDHYLLYECELCYGCLDSSRLYNCIACQDSENCRDSLFLYDCKGCNNCALSSNLRNKKYVFGNEQLGKEEYERRLKEFLEHLYDDAGWMSKSLKSVRESASHRASLIINSERCSGDYIRNCKNSHDVYDAEDLEDCNYSIYALDVKDSYDMSCAGWGELMYEVLGTGQLNRGKFSSAVVNSSDVEYCRCIWNSRDCFGCTSLHGHNQYVILNKQYSKDDYFDLRARIIEHMKSTGQWGEFFPPALSPFEYNRSMAIDRIPIHREEALNLGFKWYDGHDLDVGPASSEMPTCASCGKNYRLIEQELGFYKKMGIPKPALCWTCRLKNLIAARRPHRLVDGKCSECGVEIRTTYGEPERRSAQLRVLCEKCYQEKVY